MRLVTHRMADELARAWPEAGFVVVPDAGHSAWEPGILSEEIVSTKLAAQTMLGAATMVLVSKEHPALLKDTVTTPAGCTIDGLLELEEGKLRVTLIKAVVKAAERARQLVEKTSG